MKSVLSLLYCNAWVILAAMWMLSINMVDGAAITKTSNAGPTKISNPVHINIASSRVTYNTPEDTDVVNAISNIFNQDDVMDGPGQDMMTGASDAFNHPNVQQTVMEPGGMAQITYQPIENTAPAEEQVTASSVDFTPSSYFREMIAQRETGMVATYVYRDNNGNIVNLGRLRVNYYALESPSGKKRSSDSVDADEARLTLWSEPGCKGESSTLTAFGTPGSTDCREFRNARGIIKSIGWYNIPQNTAAYDIYENFDCSGLVHGFSFGSLSGCEDVPQSGHDYRSGKLFIEQ